MMVRSDSGGSLFYVFQCVSVAKKLPKMLPKNRGFFWISPDLRGFRWTWGCGDMATQAIVYKHERLK